MHWRARPLGCVVAAAILVVVGLGMAGLVVWGSVLSNAGGPLLGSGFQPGSGMVDAPDRRTDGSVQPVPTWRVEGAVPVTFSMTLRNDGDSPVRVTGVRRDPSGDDQQFVPERVEPVALQPGASATVTVHGRSVCEDKYGGQISGKNGQTFVYGDGETQNVDFDRALVQFVACR